MCIRMCLNSYSEGIWRWHLSFLMLFAISTANNSCMYVFRHLINANAINLPQDHKTPRSTHTHLAHTRATHSQQITHNNNNNNNEYKAFTINLKPKCCPWGTATLCSFLSLACRRCAPNNFKY